MADVRDLSSAWRPRRRIALAETALPGAIDSRDVDVGLLAESPRDKPHKCDEVAVRRHGGAVEPSLAASVRNQPVRCLRRRFEEPDIASPDKCQPLSIR